MTWPFPVPDWMPWWVPLAVLVPVLLYLLVFLVMPFSVFGLKGRLDLIEARLDDIQGELRRLASRAPEPDHAPETQRPPPPAEIPPNFGRAASSYAPDHPAPRPAPRMDAPPPGRVEPALRRRPPEEPGRVEPRLDWPRS